MPLLPLAMTTLLLAMGTPAYPPAAAPAAVEADDDSMVAGMDSFLVALFV